METNSLARVPGCKNLGNMISLHLEANKITMVAPGDFFGATQLVLLTLGSNLIVSAAPEAFKNFKALDFTPEKVNFTKKADGSELKMVYGLGACAFPLCTYSYLFTLLSLRTTVAATWVCVLPGSCCVISTCWLAITWLVLYRHVLTISPPRAGHFIIAG